MEHDAFDDRRKALEEEFFKRQNEALVKKMREAASHTATKEEIARLTGIANDQVLSALAGMHVGGAAVLVMSMLPLVEVAWADGQIDDRERRVLLEQSAALGIRQGTESSLFLAQWLDERPERTWSDLWAEYVAELCRHLSTEDRELLKHEVLGRARLVAEAAGGVLGFGWAVSGAEKAVLQRLEKAFDPAAE